MIRSMVIFSLLTLAVLTALSAAVSYGRVVKLRIEETDAVLIPEYAGFHIRNGRLTAVMGGIYTPTQPGPLPSRKSRRFGFEHSANTTFMKPYGAPDDELQPFVQREISGPAWVVVIAFATYPVVALIRGPLRRRRRRKRGLCVTCGYDLTGNVTGVCPECAGKTGSDGRSLREAGGPS